MQQHACIKRNLMYLIGRWLQPSAAYVAWRLAAGGESLPWLVTHSRLPVLHSLDATTARQPDAADWPVAATRLWPVLLNRRPIPAPVDEFVRLTNHQWWWLWFLWYVCARLMHVYFSDEIFPCGQSVCILMGLPPVLSLWIAAVVSKSHMDKYANSSCQARLLMVSHSSSHSYVKLAC